MRISAVRVAVLAALTLASTSSMAQAYRVTNQVWGEYSATTSVVLPFNGNDPFYKNETYFYDSRYTQGSSAGSVPAAASISGVDIVGNSLFGLPTVSLRGSAWTDWGHNHTTVAVSGFDPVQTSTSVPVCIPDASGFCLPGTGTTLVFNTTPNAYAYAQSRWEEIYQIGGAGGTLTATFHIEGSVGSQPSTSGAVSGNAYFYWAERDFDSNPLGSVYASYSAESDEWTKQIYSNSTGSTTTTYGNGTLSIDDDIVVQRSFVSGDAVYVDSFAQGGTYGNGISDFANTVTLTTLNLPAGARILASSGADYGGVLQFSGGSGTVCSDVNCLAGTVPEPESWAMLLAGLGTLIMLARRRRAD